MFIEHRSREKMSSMPEKKKKTENGALRVIDTLRLANQLSESCSEL